MNSFRNPIDILKDNPPDIAFEQVRMLFRLPKDRKDVLFDHLNQSPTRVQDCAWLLDLLASFEGSISRIQMCSLQNWVLSNLKTWSEIEEASGLAKNPCVFDEEKPQEFGANFISAHQNPVAALLSALFRQNSGLVSDLCQTIQALPPHRELTRDVCVMPSAFSHEVLNFMATHHLQDVASVMAHHAADDAHLDTPIQRHLVDFLWFLERKNSECVSDFLLIWNPPLDFCQSFESMMVDHLNGPNFSQDHFYTLQEHVFIIRQTREGVADQLLGLCEKINTARNRRELELSVSDEISTSPKSSTRKI